MAGLLAGAGILVLASGPAASQTFNQFVGFGDSTIDSGYYRVLPNPGGGATYNALWPAAVAAGAGKPTNSPGLMSSEALAALFGLSALPSNQGGSNYATSGAKDVTVNTTQTGDFKAAIPTVTQISNYLAANGGRANPNGLYLISSGGNDVAYATGNTGTPPFPAAQPYLISAANSLASSVASLQAAGARFIVVPDLPFSFPGGAGNADVRADRFLYSQTLWNSLAANGVNFVPADYNAMRLAIASNPALFGFQFIGNGAGQTACSQPAGVTSAWALLCSSNPGAPSQLVSPNADQTHLFADDQHLSSAGQKILADYEYSLLVAPSEISFLAEVPVKTRAAVVDAIFNQIAISERARKTGTFNVWVTGEAMSLAIHSGSTGFPSDPGTPAGVTAGIDYAIANGMIVGAAFSYGQTSQSFDLGGNFKQTDIAGSLYGAYAAGPYWGRAIGTYGGLSYDVNRIVPIGITQQSNTGNTRGRNVSFAGEFGYDFTVAARCGAGRARDAGQGADACAVAAAHARAGGRHRAAAHHSGRLHRNRSFRVDRRFHRAVIRRPDPQLRGHRTRLSGQHRLGHVAAVRQTGLESRTGFDRSLGHGRAHHRRRSLLLDARGDPRQGLGHGHDRHHRDLRA